MNLSGKYLGATQPCRIAPRLGLLMNTSNRRLPLILKMKNIK